jgi:hypothetical protein
MRKITTLLCCVILASVCVSPQAKADLPEHPFGLGLILGVPSALTFAFKFTEEDQIQSMLGWGFSPYYYYNPSFIIGIDYVHHFMSVFEPIKNGGRFAPGVGVGGVVGFFEDRARGGASSFGIRVPGQMSFYFESVPVEIYAELALGVYVWPSAWLLANGGIGARWFF